jgi:hypothetical protein
MSVYGTSRTATTSPLKATSPARIPALCPHLKGGHCPQRGGELTAVSSTCHDAERESAPLRAQPQRPQTRHPDPARAVTSGVTVAEAVRRRSRLARLIPVCTDRPVRRPSDIRSSTSLPRWRLVNRAKTSSKRSGLVDGGLASIPRNVRTPQRFWLSSPRPPCLTTKGCTSASWACPRTPTRRGHGMGRFPVATVSIDPAAAPVRTLRPGSAVARSPRDDGSQSPVPQAILPCAAGIVRVRTKGVRALPASVHQGGGDHEESRKCRRASGSNP